MRKSLKRRALKDIFVYAAEDIFRALNISTNLRALDMNFKLEVLYKEGWGFLALNRQQQVNRVLNDHKWLICKYLWNNIATVFIYPVVIPLFTLIKLPFELALHACINAVEAIKKCYKSVTAKKDMEEVPYAYAEEDRQPLIPVNSQGLSATPASLSNAQLNQPQPLLFNNNARNELSYDVMNEQFLSEQKPNTFSKLGNN